MRVRCQRHHITAFLLSIALSKALHTNFSEGKKISGKNQKFIIYYLGALFSNLQNA
jgi:hypothetical protein